jgi:glutathione S-transferase
MRPVDIAQSDPDQAMVEIYHIEGRRSFRIVWLCEELSIPYKLRFNQGDIFGSLMAIREAYPLMPVAPVVRYRGQFIVESGAILDVLLAREGHGLLRPSVDSPDFIPHTQWMHFAEGAQLARMLSERMTAVAIGVNPDGMPLGYRGSETPNAGKSQNPVAANLQSFQFTVGPHGIFDFQEAHLRDFPFFGGTQFTAADIMMHWGIRVARLMSWIDTDTYPAIARWRKEVEQREAFIRADRAATPGGADEFGQPLGVPYPFAAGPSSRAN